MSYKDIVKLTPTLQAVALAKYNVKLASKKKKSTKDFLHGGFTNIIGASLIKETGDFANAL